MDSFNIRLSSAIMFQELHKSFEKKETDLYQLQKNPSFCRYILIRSLANDHLKELIKEATGEVVKKGKAEVLYEKLFNSDLSEDRIIEFIHGEYPNIRKKRKEQEKYLPGIISNFGEVRCGIRNDNLNDTAKELVRDKGIRNIDDLNRRVDDLLEKRIRGYILWQYYNQVTNDLIEHLFNDHINIIPTLRKIKYVDFLVRAGDKIVPFDLKITHISDEYFDLAMKGLSRSEKGDDEYIIGSNKSEVEIIKNHYKSIKSTFSLPNYGGLNKTSIIDILKKVDSDDTNSFLQQVYDNRSEMVSHLEENLRSLEWWNYKFQGERLFKNNNRFFIFLAYNNSFQDARPLKGNLKAIARKVNKKLDTIINGELNKIRYYYQKDKGLEGAYIVNSTSILVTD